MNTSSLSLLLTLHWHSMAQRVEGEGFKTKKIISDVLRSSVDQVAATGIGTFKYHHTPTLQGLSPLY